MVHFFSHFLFPWQFSKDCVPIFHVIGLSSGVATGLQFWKFQNLVLFCFFQFTKYIADIFGLISKANIHLQERLTPQCVEVGTKK